MRFKHKNASSVGARSVCIRIEWWRPPESNWGHRDFQSLALPTELERHRRLENVDCDDSSVKTKKQKIGREGALFVLRRVALRDLIGIGSEIANAVTKNCRSLERLIGYCSVKFTFESLP